MNAMHSRNPMTSVHWVFYLLGVEICFYLELCVETFLRRLEIQFTFSIIEVFENEIIN